MPAAITTTTDPANKSTLVLHEPARPPLRFGLVHLFALVSVVAFILAAWSQEEEDHAAILAMAFILEVAIGLYGHFRTLAAPFFWMFACLLGLVAVAPFGVHEDGPRWMCNNNMKQLMLALHIYHDVHGHFPPAYTVDSAGRPLHSWRVLILPYIEEDKLYQQFRLDEPWNSPHNLPLAQQMPRVFRCPKAKREPTARASYVALVGPQSIWPEDKSTSFGDIHDELAHTIALMEWPESDILWTEPRDLPADNLTLLTQPTRKQLRGRHRHSRQGNVMVGFVDGTVRNLCLPKLSPLTVRALITPNGGEVINQDDLAPP